MKQPAMLILFLLACLLVACAPAVPEPTTTPAIVATESFNSINKVVIPAPSLGNNLINEPLERAIYVYLPPAYGVPDKRFPVIYYLPGYGDERMIGFTLPDSMDEQINQGKLNDMIIVIASGTNRLGGSFYVNSSVTGNWEDYIVNDVVGYIDIHYRTLAKAESRGITGHSMGGFGALNIAMHHPEIFSAVYSIDFDYSFC